MTENSAEYRTMIDLTSELRLAVRSELVTLTGSLLASRLISLDNDIELRNTSHSEVERSAKLVELVQNKVRQNPRHYHSFIGVLQGNQVQYRDILQRLEHMYEGHKQEDSHPQTIDTDVLSNMNDLECQFRLLHGRILAELEDHHVSVSMLLSSLTVLPTRIKQEYQTSIKEAFPELRRETTIREVFYHLSPLIDFLSCGLLSYIIGEYGSNTLKLMMKTYNDDLMKFMKKTTVKQLIIMDVWCGQQKIPPNFSKLRAKLDEDPTTYTLYQLDQLRRRFCGAVKLTEVVSVLIGLETSNSFIAEWLIPSTLVPLLMESAKKLEFGFYLREHILKMTVDDKQIFPMLPDAKPKVPALQAAAATVTDLPEDQEPPVTITELSSLVEQLSLSPKQEREVQRIRGELRDCAKYSGVGVICNVLDEWKPIEPHLMSSGYKIIPNDLSPHLGRSLFSSTAWSIAKPPTTAESSRSPPFVIAVFVSGIGEDLAHHTIMNSISGEMRIVDDIIRPFLPQLAPHLQHIPKLFFITALGYPDATPPHFPDDPDGNYCAAYYVTYKPRYMRKWAEYISDNLFLRGMTVQEAIESSKYHLVKDNEYLHYFTCLQNKSLVLK